MSEIPKPASHWTPKPREVGEMSLNEGDSKVIDTRREGITGNVVSLLDFGINPNSDEHRVGQTQIVGCVDIAGGFEGGPEENAKVGIVTSLDENGQEAYRFVVGVRDPETNKTVPKFIELVQGETYIVDERKNIMEDFDSPVITGAELFGKPFELSGGFMVKVTGGRMKFTNRSQEVLGIEGKELREEETETGGTLPGVEIKAVGETTDKPVVNQEIIWEAGYKATQIGRDAEYRSMIQPKQTPNMGEVGKNTTDGEVIQSLHAVVMAAGETFGVMSLHVGEQSHGYALSRFDPEGGRAKLFGIVPHDSGSFIVGREHHKTLAQDVSRKHFGVRIEREAAAGGESIVVTDHGSKNGTTVFTMPTSEEEQPGSEPLKNQWQSWAPKTGGIKDALDAAIRKHDLEDRTVLTGNLDPDRTVRM